MMASFLNEDVGSNLLHHTTAFMRYRDQVEEFAK